MCNLYPFVKTVSTPGVTVEDAVEQIDIGELCCSNCQHVGNQLFGAVSIMAAKQTILWTALLPASVVPDLKCCVCLLIPQVASLF